MNSALSRRALLGGSAAVLAASTLTGCDPEPVQPPAGAPPLNVDDWDNVKAQFGLDPSFAQLAAYVFASHPAPVRAAIDAHRAGLDADPTGYLLQHEEKLDQAVGTAAAGYWSTSAEQIAFTDSTTMGLGTLYAGLILRPGDEVLTTEHDFYSTHEALRLRQLRDGVTVRKVRLFDRPDTASVDEIVGKLLAAMTDRTRVLAITWVHSSTGLRLPVRQISAAIATLNAGRSESDKVLVCVDGVHGFGAVAANPGDLGCDFLVSGGHKWLFGPRGTGLIWGSKAGWARYVPVIPSFHGPIAAWLGLDGAPVPPGANATPGGYHSFEHRWALAQAFEFHAALGRDRVAARTAELAATLKDGLATIDGVTVVTPKSPELSAGLVCCSVEGMEPGGAIVGLHAAKVIASATPYNPALLRFGTTIATSPTDVEQTLRAVRALA